MIPIEITYISWRLGRPNSFGGIGTVDSSIPTLNLTDRVLSYCASQGSCSDIRARRWYCQMHPDKWRLCVIEYWIMMDMTLVESPVVARLFLCLFCDVGDVGTLQVSMVVMIGVNGHWVKVCRLFWWYDIGRPYTLSRIYLEIVIPHPYWLRIQTTPETIQAKMQWRDVTIDTKWMPKHYAWRDWQLTLL